MVDRLAAYEDTGFTPDELKDLSFKKVAELAAFIKERDVDHLREMVLAEEDGRLVVLPCAPDSIYYQWKRGDNYPSVSRFEGIFIDEDRCVHYKTTFEDFMIEDFGKTVFLTRKEAEAALQKEKT